MNQQNIQHNTERCSTQSVSSICLFGLGTCAWALVNAIFAELPILIPDWCDNDWSIVSSIALCISISNLAPFAWTALLSINQGEDKARTMIGIGIILFVGTTTSLLFIFLNQNATRGFVLFMDSKTWILLLSSFSGLVG